MHVCMRAVHLMTNSYQTRPFRAAMAANRGAHAHHHLLGLRSMPSLSSGQTHDTNPALPNLQTVTNYPIYHNHNSQLVPHS